MSQKEELSGGFVIPEEEKVVPKTKDTVCNACFIMECVGLMNEEQANKWLETTKCTGTDDSSHPCEHASDLIRKVNLFLAEVKQTD